MAHEENVAHSPALLPVHLEIALFHLRKPSSWRVADPGEAQGRIDPGGPGEHGKPVGDRAGERVMQIEDECIVERPLDEIIIIDPDTGSGAAGGPASDLIGGRMNGLSKAFSLISNFRPFLSTFVLPLNSSTVK